MHNGVPRPAAFLPAPRERVARIAWYINVRWTAVVGIVAFVEVARRVLPVHLHLALLYGIAVALGLVPKKVAEEHLSQETLDELAQGRSPYMGGRDGGKA